MRLAAMRDFHPPRQRLYLAIAFKFVAEGIPA
jgi:hypothetical protein